MESFQFQIVFFTCTFEVVCVCCEHVFFTKYHKYVPNDESQTDLICLISFCSVRLCSLVCKESSLLPSPLTRVWVAKINCLESLLPAAVVAPVVSSTITTGSEKKFISSTYDILFSVLTLSNLKFKVGQMTIDMV